MSWENLLAKNRVTVEPPTRSEFDRLRSIVTRSLKDAATADLSAGAHYNTFLALEAADPAFAELSAYFDGCRMKRNECEYDFAGGISETDAGSLFKTVCKFAKDCEAWVSTRRPELA